jgi:hypothetical protein
LDAPLWKFSGGGGVKNNLDAVVVASGAGSTMVQVRERQWGQGVLARAGDFAVSKQAVQGHGGGSAHGNFAESEGGVTQNALL